MTELRQNIPIISVNINRLNSSVKKRAKVKRQLSLTICHLQDTHLQSGIKRQSKTYPANEKSESMRFNFSFEPDWIQGQGH